MALRDTNKYVATKLKTVGNKLIYRIEIDPRDDSDVERYLAYAGFTIKGNVY